MLKVGLTGGIGCGKTTVSNHFKQLGIPVIDADLIAHRLVEPSQPALQQITDEFGEEFLQISGSLDRTKLRNLVFNHPEKKQLLEGIMHPLVFAAIQNEVDRLSSAYCIISIPLLFETGMQAIADRVLVVDCLETEQIQRVEQRDKLDESIIRAIVASQIARTDRLAQADDVIDNSANNNNLAAQVEKLHNFYESISTSLR